MHHTRPWEAMLLKFDLAQRFLCAKVSPLKTPDFIQQDHFFLVPLDHQQPDGPQITVYARELVSPQHYGEDLPIMVFFQGGPGCESPRPLNKVGWIGRALEDYRVLLLDQRGTGRSSPINYQSLAGFDSPEAQAAYLSHFRADSIVRDAELIRKELTGDEPWTALGQSFGGWCIFSYLSLAPEGLRGAMITGGIPPLNRSIDEVYRTTFANCEQRNQTYYERFPEDLERSAKIADFLDQNEVMLPRGGRLLPRRFQQLGQILGGSHGQDVLHFLMENPFIQGSTVEMHHNFLCDIERETGGFETHPLYALLHEAIYTEGPATAWSAQRVRETLPIFSPEQRPLHFTGEKIFPWMFDDYPRLQPLKACAEIIAHRDDWTPLYDRDQISRNEVPVAAAVYADDLYVVREFSEETAATIPNLKTWVTPDYEHNGLRMDGRKILNKLIGML